MSTLGGDSGRDHREPEGAEATPDTSITASLGAGVAALEDAAERSINVIAPLGQDGLRSFDSFGSATNLAVRDLPETVGSRLLRGIGKDLIAAWRDQLVVQQDAARMSVAAAISYTIADTNLASLVAQSLAVNPFADSRPRTFGELAVHYIDSARVALRERVITSIKPAALLATSSLLEWIRTSNAQEQEFEAALRRAGWWIPSSATTRFLFHVGQLAAAGRRTDVRRAMVAASRSREFGRSVERWMDLPEFRERRRFIRDGLADHNRGRYRVSIPMLLPHIEGIALAAFAPGSTDTNPKRAISTAVRTYDAVTGPSIAEAVTVLWAHQDFGVVLPGSRRLNRQLILHGRSTGYATAENSAKVLFALDLLASLIEDARRHPEWTKAS